MRLLLSIDLGTRIFSSTFLPTAEKCGVIKLHKKPVLRSGLGALHGALKTNSFKYLVVHVDKIEA